MSDDPSAAFRANPFTPDFGQQPPLLAGRDDICGHLRLSLKSGASNPDFTSIVLGVRGSGKTALVHSVAQAVKGEGWPVLWVSSGRRGAIDLIRAAIDEAELPNAKSGKPPQNAKERRWWRNLTGVNAFGFGLNWRRPGRPGAGSDDPIEYRLRDMAERAKARGVGVLLCMDELQAADLPEMRTVGDAIQRVTKLESLPLAFLGAGLGDMRFGLLADQQSTFLQRCARAEIGLLAPESVIAGLRVPVENADGSISNDALTAAASRGPLLPFHLQLVGRKMWEIAGAPLKEIDLFAVETAFGLARADMEAKVYEPAWFALPDSEQAVLAFLARAEGRCGVVELRATGLQRRTIQDACRRLAHRGYVTHAEQDIQAAGLIPEDFVKQMAARGGISQPGQSGGASQRRTPGRPVVRERCGKLMPLANARCVLPDGHPGGCRSRT